MAEHVIYLLGGRYCTVTVWRGKEGQRGDFEKPKGEILRNHRSLVIIMFPVSSGFRSPKEMASKGMQILPTTVTQGWKKIVVEKTLLHVKMRE